LILNFVCFLSAGNDRFREILSSKNPAESDLRMILDSAKKMEYSHPELAEKYTQSIISAAQKSGQKLLEADAYTYMGLLCEDISEFGKAAEYFNKSLKIFISINNKKGEATTYNNLGSMYDYIGKHDSSLIYYNKSLVINKEIGNELGYADNLYNMGALYDTKGNYDAAFRNWFDALKIFEKINDYEGKGACEQAIGLLMRRQEKYDQALEYFSQAYESSLKSKDERLIGNVILSSGNVYLDMKDYAKAKKKFIESREVFIRANDAYGAAASLTNLGDIYKYTGQTDSAILCYSQSNQLFKDVNVVSGIAHTYAAMTECYVLKNRLDLAEENCGKALEYAGIIQSKDYISKIFHLYYQIYRNRGQMARALEYHVKYSEMKDSLFNDNKQKIIEELQTKYETEKKEQKILLQQSEIEKQEAMVAKERLQKYGVAAIGFLFIILSFVVYRNYRQKRKANILLSAKNEKILQQNEEITSQRDEIAAQRDLATNQRDIIAKQQKDIKDSIHYAFQIQSALFPTDEDLRLILKDYFIFYRPRDIVSGDFYWVNKFGNKIIIVASDCTGHGVPGAFMSMLGIAFLNEIVNKEQVTAPDKILNRLRENIILAMKQHGENVKQQDGMDAVAITIDRQSGTLEFAGANNPLYIVSGSWLRVPGSGNPKPETRNPELIELKGDKMPVAIYSRMQPFTLHSSPISGGDLIYIFSDGFADQFGGPEGKKFKYKPLKELLTVNSQQPMAVQKEALAKTFDDWRGNVPQIDDVLIIGIKV
jgi:serine phosphatase RsbU (regulator of sigma subunit)/uncharacterized protein HemY